MEMSIVFFILFTCAVSLLWNYLSELHAKMDILMDAQDIDWQRYFTDDLREHLVRGRPAEAAMILRKQTGLSFKQCVAIVNKTKTGSANTQL